MKLGILADIHEADDKLRKAIDVLGKHGADRFVVLGDVLETGQRINETVRLLREIAAVGVWGNHDFGICNPDEAMRTRYSPVVIDYMTSLQPRLEVEGCLFTHIEPWLNPNKIEDLWYFDGPPDTMEKLARSFTAVPNQVMFLGHFHRWLLGTPSGVTAWPGETPVNLGRDRHLVVVHAVWAGRYAMFGTTTQELVPFGESRVESESP